MPIRNLDKIFNPGHVAVIGASRKSSSVGHAVLRNLIDAQFPGPIFPVNPKYERIGQHTCYPRVADLPEPPDLAVICTPAPTVPQLVRECGEAGILGLIILSAGFRETGAHGESLHS